MDEFLVLAADLPPSSRLPSLIPAHSPNLAVPCLAKSPHFNSQDVGSLPLVDFPRLDIEESAFNLYFPLGIPVSTLVKLEIHRATENLWRRQVVWFITLLVESIVPLSPIPPCVYTYHRWLVRIALCTPKCHTIRHSGTTEIILIDCNIALERKKMKSLSELYHIMLAKCHRVKRVCRVDERRWLSKKDVTRDPCDLEHSQGPKDVPGEGLGNSAHNPTSYTYAPPIQCSTKRMRDRLSILPVVRSREETFITLILAVLVSLHARVYRELERLLMIQRPKQHA